MLLDKILSLTFFYITYFGGRTDIARYRDASPLKKIVLGAPYAKFINHFKKLV